MRITGFLSPLVACVVGASLLAGCLGHRPEPVAPPDDGVERSEGFGPGGVSVAGSVRWIGRVDTRSPDAPSFSWSYSGFAVHFRGHELRAKLANTLAFYFVVLLDGQPVGRFQSIVGARSYVLASGLAEGEHVLEVHRESEGQYGASSLLGLSGATILRPEPGPERLIEIVGDSVTCGYGVLGVEHHRPELNDGCTYSFQTESVFESYGVLAARSLGADLSIVATSGWGVFRGKDHSLKKNVPSVYERILAEHARPAYDFRREPDLVVVGLGANDVTPPVSDPGEENFVASYRKLLETVRAHYPHAWVVCAVSATLSDDYPPDIHARSIIRGWTERVVDERVQRGDPRVSYLEFPRHDDAVTGCDWHPSRAAHRRMAEILAHEARERLGW